MSGARSLGGRSLASGRRGGDRASQGAGRGGRRGMCGGRVAAWGGEGRRREAVARWRSPAGWLARFQAQLLVPHPTSIWRPWLASLSPSSSLQLTGSLLRREMMDWRRRSGELASGNCWLALHKPLIWGGLNPGRFGLICGSWELEHYLMRGYDMSSRGMSGATS